MAVAWASTSFPGYDALLRERTKIIRAAVGILFYQTHPAFIQQFISDSRFRFVLNPSGVFHPKLYLFETSESSWACLLGSGNFTPGGFGINDEAFVLIRDTDDPGGTILGALRQAMQDYWQKGKQLTDPEFESYRRRWEHNRPRLRAISGDHGDKGLPPHEIRVLNMSLPEFINRVQHDRHNSLDERLVVIREARNLFEQHDTFNDIPIDFRKRLAGFTKSGAVDWGWFGRMGALGGFMQRVNAGDQHLSDALDNIPLRGPVVRDQYIAFVNQYHAAFQTVARRPGIAAASRLLAMKRPDYFVCLTGQNEKALFDEFEISMKHDDYLRYWDSIIERIINSVWWSAPRPTSEPDATIWDARAAFLDSLYDI
jgi:hypothetical protein